jgi:hypothetical protein
MQMRTPNPALYACVASMLVGCGTSVPEIQDIGDSAVGQQLVQAIVTNITCEVQDGINRIYKHRHSTFLDSWGVQITLNLTIEEKGSVSPSLKYLPTTMFSLGADGSFSSDATRTDKLNSYYTVKELLRLGPCDPADRTHGTLLRADDLKLTEWLFDNLTASDTGEIHYGDDSKGPFGQNVISHEVKFEVVLSGDITPGWMLKFVTINPTAPFLSAKRDKTHDLIMTLGPTDASGKAPSQAAANAALASDIGVAVGNNVKNLRTQ